MSKLPYVLVSALVGALLGFMGGRYASDSAPSSPSSSSAPAPAPEEARRERRRLRRGQLPGVSSERSAPPRAERNVAGLSEAELRAELEEAREELAVLREEQHADQGKSMPFPHDLDPKFEKEALVDKLNEAFKKEGVEAEVDVADCNEYPCILCSTLGRDEGNPDLDKHLSNMRKVAESDVLSNYEDAARHGSAFSKQSKEGDKNTNATVVCQALYPKPDDEAVAEDIRRRIKHRTSQLEESY